MDNSGPGLFGAEQHSLYSDSLNVVYAQYRQSEPFSLRLFEGYKSLRVLTYSVSIPMTVLVSGEDVPLDVQEGEVRADARLLMEYFDNFANDFHGSVK